MSRADARRAFGVEEGVLLIGHAGRLVAVKDQSSLIESAVYQDVYMHAIGLRRQPSIDEAPVPPASTAGPRW